jgi:hypothetical protein
LPRIRFSDLPPALWKHLLLRVEQRQIRFRELQLLQAWVQSEPQAPDGEWYKDFGAFLLCGSGEFPKTVLLRGMKPYGQKIE